METVDVPLVSTLGDDVFLGDGAELAFAFAVVERVDRAVGEPDMVTVENGSVMLDKTLFNIGDSSISRSRLDDGLNCVAVQTKQTYETAVSLCLLPPASFGDVEHRMAVGTVAV